MDHIEQEIEGYCDRIRTLERENRALDSHRAQLAAALQRVTDALEVEYQEYNAYPYLEFVKMARAALKGSQ